MSARIVQHNLGVNLTGKRAIVVGGTNGIGRAMALRLAQAQAGVTVVGRNSERGQEVVAEMTKLAPSAKHEFKQVDASMIGEIRAFCADYTQNHDRLDFVSLSPGIATIQGRTETREGIDVKLSLHYFGRVEFARRLAPLMEKTAQKEDADVRLLTILSAGVHAPFAKYEEDPELIDNYSIKNAADAAGFYNDIAVDALSKEHPTVTYLHSSPGFIATAWGTEMPWYIRGPVRLLQKFARSPADCAEYMCFGLFSDEFKGGFRLLSEKGKEVKTTALHEQARDKVWDHTVKMLDARK